MSVGRDGSVRHQVVVDLPQEKALWAFAGLDPIKPREHNKLTVPIERTVLEKRAGGDVYDQGVDGSVCRWGRVLAFDPPNTIVFSWDIGPDWQVATDLERTSEVEVTFTADDDGQTTVTLVHRYLERQAPAGRACAMAWTSMTGGRSTWLATRASPVVRRAPDDHARLHGDGRAGKIRPSGPAAHPDRGPVLRAVAVYPVVSVGHRSTCGRP